MAEESSTTFDPNSYDWQQHLKKALQDMATKIPLVDTEWSYYDGNHPKLWMTDNIRNMFNNELPDRMSENWCDFVVDAAVQRLTVEGWLSPGAEGDNVVNSKAAQIIFDDNSLSSEQKDIYRQVRAVGECYLFAWRDPDANESGIDINLQDARNVWWPKDCHRADPDRVVQIWMDEEEDVWRATLYYRYSAVRLVGPRINQTKSLPQARYFELDSEDPGGLHGFDKVPVIRFALSRRRQGVIDKIRNIQDKINKLEANKMVSAEFAAFMKTIVLTTQNIDDDTLKFRPDRAIVLDPGGDSESGVAPTSVWQGEATELRIYDDSVGKEIDKLLTKANMPGHMQVKAEREVPSGASYEADEGPFVEMLEDMQEAFDACWSDLFSLFGIDVKPQWRNPKVKSDTDEMVTVKTAVEAGMPIKLALKYYAGWDDEKLEELDQQPLSPKETQALAITQALTADVNRSSPDENAVNTPPGSGTPPRNDGPSTAG